MRVLQVTRGKNDFTFRNLAWAFSINIVKQGSKVYKLSFQNLQVQFVIVIFLFAGKFLVLGKISGQKSFKIIVALNV